MTQGVLLDSHALLWMDEGTSLRLPALFAIAEATTNRQLFASHISIWELGVAAHKKDVTRRPNLRGLTPLAWFADATGNLQIRSTSITARIANEAADVPLTYGYGDPGDCMLIATARIRNLTLITRDARILALAERAPGYLNAIPC